LADKFWGLGHPSTHRLVGIGTNESNALTTNKVVTALSHAPAFVDLNGIEPTRAGK
jgi:hypothetical protein